jgi:hypothetical protein
LRKKAAPADSASPSAAPQGETPAAAKALGWLVTNGDEDIFHRRKDLAEHCQEIWPGSTLQPAFSRAAIPAPVPQDFRAMIEAERQEWTGDFRKPVGVALDSLLAKLAAPTTQAAPVQQTEASAKEQVLSVYPEACATWDSYGIIRVYVSHRSDGDLLAEEETESEAWEAAAAKLAGTAEEAKE